MGYKLKEKTHILVIGALGVVFGDIGTSPLYTVRVCFTGQNAIPPSSPNVLGFVSLIFWALTLVVSIKYALFILRADDEGQGGVFAMLASLHKKMGANLGRGLVLAGLFGSALLYGDGLITPVISVLSALEGLEVATTQAKPLVLPLTCVVLFLLFWAQSHGTGRIGKFFGPIMILWFAVIALLGIIAIARKPEILAAVNPQYAAQFFLNNGLRGFFLLGAVVLCITGCEALFADLGHFGVKSIRLAWYFVALPALLCNYFGQGALLLHNPQAAADPFYSLVPRTLLYPMVALATAATIIASQALISGAFSLTNQAVQLGFFPRVMIKHTSDDAEGQIYVPEINWLLAGACLALVLWAGSSSRLAAAYGIAVTGTMAITSIVYFVVVRQTWRWPLLRAVPLLLFFLAFDIPFFVANAMKFLHGGYVPMVIGAVFFAMMVIWRRGRRMLSDALHDKMMPVDAFLADIDLEGRRGSPLLEA